MPESTQHKLDRIRPPRVQITYDVETRGSFVKMELPFVVGIMANLSGAEGEKDKDGNIVPLRDKKYMEIDRDNFNDVMKHLGPEVAVNGSVLKFETLDDFSPIKVLEKLGANTQFVRRKQLSDVVAKLDGNPKLQRKFFDLLTDDTQRANLKTALTNLKGLLPPEQNGATAQSTATTTDTSKAGDAGQATATDTDAAKAAKDKGQAQDKGGPKK